MPYFTEAKARRISDIARRNRILAMFKSVTPEVMDDLKARRVDTAQSMDHVLRRLLYIARKHGY
jgi:hypothetical protein